MASRVEEFDDMILQHAKKEFLEKGFNDASLRTIAGNAGVSTSTIYTRYVDKEGLFRYLVAPAFDGMIDYIGRSLNSFEVLPADEQPARRDEFSDRGFGGLIDLLYRYYDEFKLLVTCAPSYFYQDFLEQIVALDMECTRIFLQSVHCPAYENGEISNGFLHVVSSAFYAGVFEVVVHDMPRKEAETYINMLRKFYNSGWKDYF